MDQDPSDTSAVLLGVLQDAPGAERLVLVDEAGEVAGAAGGAIAPDAGHAVSELWSAACRAAGTRSPSPLDHLVLRTTIGDAVVVRVRQGLLAAVGRTGTRPDRVACELRCAAERFALLEYGATGARAPGGFTGGASKGGER